MPLTKPSSFIHYKEHPLSNGLLFFAPLWEQGGNAVDLVGGRVGTRASNVTPSYGALGQCTTFPAATDTTGAVTFSHNGQFQGLTEQSFACWAYITGAGGGGFGRILTCNDNSGFSMNYQSSTQINYSVAANNANATVPSTINTWLHLCVTFSASVGLISFYANGSLVSTTVRTIVTPSGTNPLIIGNRATGGRGHQGQIDGVAFWNRCLNIGEVQALYQDHYAMFRPKYRTPFGAFDVPAATGGPWPFFYDCCMSGGFSTQGI